jgi:hypothetical protein
VLAFVTAAAGCSLFVDTGGFESGDTPAPDGGGANDGPTSADSGGGDVTTTNDAGDEASSDAGADAAVGPVADWPVEEGTGTTINDLSGHAHHGIVLGTASWVDDAEGQPAEGLSFPPDSGAYVSIAGGPDFDRTATGAFTMSAWAKFDTAPNHDVFFSVNFAANDSAYGIEVKTATTINYWDNINHVAEATVPSVTGAWHHYGIVVDGAQARIYFDGIRISQGVADTTPRTSTQVFLGRSSYGNQMTGAIDRVRFFRVALTDAQMMDEKNRF